MKEYVDKLNSIEKRTEELLKELELPFSAKRMFSFSTMNLLDFEESKSFKIIASENFTDLKSAKTVKTALGEVTQYKKKTTKHQIFLLGNRKLKQLTKEEAIEYLEKGIELLGLYKQYRATREAFQSEYEVLFAENISANNLSILEPVDREQSEYIAYRRKLKNDKEYKQWSEKLFELDTEDESIQETKDKELSNR
ncbi:hypothetical protein ALC152_04900 [Arcobacter sp. 15-2]|uniref:hypothetical protein n=1 Tax=Arcobacter sp. 15-2 TaxID=3374109 RepID=UPI00399D162E